MTEYSGKASPNSGSSGGGSITVDQTYDATSSNAQSGTAVAEALLTISGGLENTATGTNSLTILGTATNTNNSVNIGYGSSVSDDNSIALGYGATSTSSSEFVVGFGFNRITPISYKLLDGATGKIPNDRINVDVNPTQNSTNFVTSGTIYNVLGDINTLLAAI